MIYKPQIQKLILATLLLLAVHFVFAAFTTIVTGHSGLKSKTSKYTLKNISKFSNRGMSLGNLRYPLQMKPTELLSTPRGLEMNRGLEFTKGNTTFIYPYKIKIKVPKFKAPSPIAH